MKKITIEGMSCMHCVKHVTNALETLGSNVLVNLDNKNAILETNATNEEIIELIDEEGYEVVSIEEM